MDVIEKFIQEVEHLSADTIDNLCCFYNSNAVFVHPFKTVVGREAIRRQWKMTLRYCPNTKIQITHTTYLKSGCKVDWNHWFDGKGRVSIQGKTLLHISNEQIIAQQDAFHLPTFYSLFG